MKILVCCHKEVELPKNEIYLPIHVGKSLSNKELNMQVDNTGDNISIKNRNYCELTGLYWAWKNLSNTSIIGLCHYRRFFNITKDNIQHILEHKKYDFIVAKHRSRPTSISEEIIAQLTKEDFIILYATLINLFPTKKKIIDKYFFNMNIYNPYNMMICKKEQYNSYCEWLFNILAETEKYVKLSEYSRLRRIFGYMGEYLLSLYIILNNCKVKEIEVINTETSGKLSNLKSSLINTYHSLRFYFLKIPRHSEYTDVISGLKMDGIHLIDKI